MDSFTRFSGDPRNRNAGLVHKYARVSADGSAARTLAYRPVVAVRESRDPYPFHRQGGVRS